jgi:hypothetical protein
MTYLQANSFLMTRAGLSLDSRSFTPLQLQGLAGTAANSQHMLVLKHAESLSTIAQMSIASSGRGFVVFDFEE